MPSKPKPRYCDCGSLLPKGIKVCDSCKVARYAASVKRAHSAETERRRVQGLAERTTTFTQYPQVERIKPWVKRKAAKIMTDTEQRKLDKAVADKLNASCGYFHGAAQTLSPAEISALAPHIQPPQRRVVIPYAVACQW